VKDAIVTGGRGFAGTHLTAALLEQGRRVTTLDRSQASWPEWAKSIYPGTDFSQAHCIASSMSSVDELKEILANSNADVFHLAGSAFVPESWEKTVLTVESNTLIPVRLFEAARDSSFSGRIVFVSSGEVYGSQPQAFAETSGTNPETPYAESKLAAESFVRYFVKQGVEIVIARSFNHIGPGQRDSFVLPSFLGRIREAVREGNTVMRVGDLESGRDFLDVRDVVRAYMLLAEKGKSGEVYNVCSGKPTKIRAILDTALSICKTNLKPEVDPSLLRKEGPADRYGSNAKLCALGWSRSWTMEQTISDTWKVIQSNG
jgi:GDP-4-dehydro-6-deoxy-D-mannose reductase